MIIAERPKIKPYVTLMKKSSKILEIDNSLIGIKATTNEKLGQKVEGGNKLSFGSFT